MTNWWNHCSCRFMATVPDSLAGCDVVDSYKSSVPMNLTNRFPQQFIFVKFVGDSKVPQHLLRCCLVVVQTSHPLIPPASRMYCQLQVRVM